MTFWNYLFFLIVEPLKLVFEVIFFYAYKATGNAGWSILVMSLAVNFLVLPLYKRADALQAEERDIQSVMSPMIKHIKSTFKGDERFMMLQEYYKINNYKPVYALKSSISLFLQIPFFIAAYSFLSHLDLLNGISLGPVRDLSMPDALISIGSLNINLLPILMTVINIVSSFIYTNKGPLKDKLKLIAVALVFLVLLYGSPSGLVFYWTLNNLFSLVKNIVMNIKKPALKKDQKLLSAESKGDMITVLLCCSVLAVMTGIMIPSDIITKNPAELVNTFIDNPHSPMQYVLSSALIAFGTFMIWVPVFFYLVKGKHGKRISHAFIAAVAVGIINHIVFNKDLGLLTYRLIYEKHMSFTAWELILNLAVDIIVFAGIMFICQKKPDFTKKLIVVFMLSVFAISVTSIGFYYYAYRETKYDLNSYGDISIPMSATGQNVVVIMMDRMIGAYIPYIFTENPELASSFDGFTYYPNTVSLGEHTNFAAPSLFGGYEYTPDMLNARSDELLVDKHNESLKVLPTLFANNGWYVTVGDPPYANYQWLADTSIYDDNPDIHAYNFSRSMKSEILSESGIELEERLNRNFFCYGLMRTLPYLFQPVIYSDGSYNHFYNDSVPENMNGTYIREHQALSSLSEFTTVTDSDQNCFAMFANETTHEVCLLSDETFDAPPVVNNVPMYLDNEESYKHYQCDAEACILLAQWLDYLRENGVYDNTRIIIVSDHGYGLNNFDDLIVMEYNFDAEWVNPVLLVKDFGQTGFTVSGDFMTNADTPYLASSGVIEDPVNPFTDKPITAKDASACQLVYVSHEFSTITNNGTQFKDPKGYWLTVHNDIWNDANWELYEPS